MIFQTVSGLRVAVLTGTGLYGFHVAGRRRLRVFPGALLSPLIEMSRLSHYLCNVKDDEIYAKLFRMRQGGERENLRN